MRYRFEFIDDEENVLNAEYEDTTKLDRKHFSGKSIKTLASDIRVGDIVLMSGREYTLSGKEEV